MVEAIERKEARNEKLSHFYLEAGTILKGHRMIEPILSLAFSVHSNKGIYALLIGSGVSRSAGIPTGWEVVLDLIRKLAHLKAEDCEPDPEAWYKASYGETPDYSKLLDEIAKSSAERSQLLRSYFEPSEEDREQSLKVPTGAHRAIAELVAGGYIRVIVTTNFDRLLETALEITGITPMVLSTPDAIEGALPLTHTPCAVIKLHGDYLDTRIKNTPSELSRYDEKVNRLLDRILDEYGLIVCGWSGEWDAALRAALERSKSHRFTTFWATRGKPSESTMRLIELRRAVVLPIRDADQFFQDIAEKVFALDTLAKPHPLSEKVAVATLKRYLADEHQRIRLHDLITQETENLYVQLGDQYFSINVEFSGEELQNRVLRYDALAEKLLCMIVTGCYWGEQSHEEFWVKCIERISNPLEARAGNRVLNNLRWYPALLLFYGGGVAALAAKRYGTFSALLMRSKERQGVREYPLAYCLYTWAVMDERTGNKLPGIEQRATPLSDYLHGVLRDPLREFLPRDEQYEECFDRFEYLLALVHADLRQKEGDDIWGPVGRFGWRHKLRSEDSITRIIGLEIDALGERWPPLQAGLFDGSLERFQSIKNAFDDQVRKSPIAF